MTINRKVIVKFDSRNTIAFRYDIFLGVQEQIMIKIVHSPSMTSWKVGLLQWNFYGEYEQL